MLASRAETPKAMKPTLLLLASAVAAQHGADYAQSMGPVAFMWPPDRVWGATQDNTAPCGSVAGVSNRTNFPLREEISLKFCCT